VTPEIGGADGAGGNGNGSDVSEGAAGSVPGRSGVALELTVLGCSGSYPAAGVPASGYLVRSPATTVLLDAGPGTLANLQQHVALTDLDAVVLSHSHPDHWVDLTVLRTALRYYLGHEGLRVYGTGETRFAAGAVVGELEPTFSWTVVDDATEPAQVGDLSVYFSRTDHPVETYALRVEQDAGPSLAYSADTGPGWSEAVPFVVGADLFLCEATHPDTQQSPGSEVHVSARQAGAWAEAADVGQLVLTHLAPGVSVGAQQAEAAAEFDGPVDVAEVGVSYGLG
jgi:ribonuclease BN (tRNA processing enzyme)